MIKGYHTDNVIFDVSEFMEDLFNKQQKIRFSGDVASHQNGSAERSIKRVVTMARTVLIYAALRCPKETFSTDIWPTAMDNSVWVYNQIPDVHSVLSAIGIWSRSMFVPVS